MFAEFTMNESFIRIFICLLLQMPVWGKGALTLSRELVAPINRNLHELSKRLEQEYKGSNKRYIKGKKRWWNDHAS